MTKPYHKVLDLEKLQDSGTEILYEFGEIQNVLNESVNTGIPLCFFLFGLDIEFCVSAVKEVLRAPARKDQREAEIVLEDNRVIKLYEVMAVCRYEESGEI